eukprot:2164641-Prymnesium_polylepis.2
MFARLAEYTAHARQPTHPSTPHTPHPTPHSRISAPRVRPQATLSPARCSAHTRRTRGVHARPPTRAPARLFKALVEPFEDEREGRRELDGHLRLERAGPVRPSKRLEHRDLQLHTLLGRRRLGLRGRGPRGSGGRPSESSHAGKRAGKRAEAAAAGRPGAAAGS